MSQTMSYLGKTKLPWYFLKEIHPHCVVKVMIMCFYVRQAFIVCMICALKNHCQKYINHNQFIIIICQIN